MDLVSEGHNVSAHGGYLPLSMVGAIISVNKFITLAHSYLGLTSVIDLDRVFLEQYLSSWEYIEQNGILNRE